MKQTKVEEEGEGENQISERSRKRVEVEIYVFEPCADDVNSPEYQQDHTKKKERGRKVTGRSTT